jgi:plastocyanin
MKTKSLFKLAVLLPLAFAGLPALANDPKEHAVDQKDKEFSVTEITVKPGDKLTFKNGDSVTHNVFSNSKANAFTIKIQQPGQSSTVDFKDEGVTEVRCAIHPKMKLLVTVKN